MMEFIFGIAEFLLQAVILLGVFLLAVAGVLALTQRKRGAGEEGSVEARSLNERFDLHEESVRAVADDPVELKARSKEQKKDKKAERKASKLAIKAGETPADAKSRVFVLDFDGDMQASQVEQLREEISAVLTLASSSDEVLLRLESGGGVVHGYGLAASQLLRIKDAGVKLTISVDKVAASGGYMMACVANEILVAPFAILGSIGVVAQLPNFHKLLKKNDIDFEMHTAGEYKRTLTVFGENTDKAREKFQADLDDVHGLFKSFVSTHRPSLDIDAVSTGEYWFGQQTLENNLADRLCTSDSFLMERRLSHDLIGVRYRNKKGWQERLGMAAETVVERGIRRFIKTGQDQQFL